MLCWSRFLFRLRRWKVIVVDPFGFSFSLVVSLLILREID